MLPFPANTQLFEGGQSFRYEVEYWDTPFTVLHNDVASGGMRMDVINPTSPASWTLPTSIKTLAEDTDISTTFRAAGTLAVDNGRTANAIGYWAGGAPGHHGAETNGLVAYHLYGKLRTATGRDWFAGGATPTWYLGVGGQGWVRIDKKVGAVWTTIFNAAVTETDYLLHGLAVSEQISDMAAGDELHVYYVQGANDPWGGFVFKAVAGSLPGGSTPLAVRDSAQTALRDGHVLGCGLIDDGIVSQQAAEILARVDDPVIRRRRGAAATSSFRLPLMAITERDGVGYEFVRSTVDDPGVIKQWSGGQTSDFTIKQQRLCRVKIGFEGETLTKTFTGLVDDFDKVTDGVAEVRCAGFEQRLLEQFDKNYPDKISYMSRGYKKLTGTSEPAYETPAFDNWPLEYAIAELMIRKGIDASRLAAKHYVTNANGTTTLVQIGSEIFRKFRARTFAGKLLKLERAVRYGNNGIAFSENYPSDDPYVFPPENSREVWNRTMEMVDRYGYELHFDEEGDARLQPRNNPCQVYNINPADATAGTLTTDVNPSAYQGNYSQATAAVTIQKTVQGARVDVCLPRGPGLGSVTCNVYRASAPGTIIATLPLAPAATEATYFYDFRSATDGINATLATVITGDFDTYIIELVGATAATRRFDCIFTYHTDPTNPRLPSTLKTASNALSVEAEGVMDDMRNVVTVVGRRKAAVTDSEKSVNPNNPESEFVVSRAVDVASITDPTATNFIGYPRESVIYSKEVTDDDFAQYLARVFIFRQRVPHPAAPVEHTLLPVVQINDPVHIEESSYQTITNAQVVYISGIEHRFTLDKAITRLETSAFPEFPAYEPREDIDIDQAQFGGNPVMNISVSYTSLTGHVQTNLTNDAVVPNNDSDIVHLFSVSVASGELSFTGQSWPPVPGTMFIRPAWNTNNITTITGSIRKVSPGANFPPLSVPNVRQISAVKVRRYARASIYNATQVLQETLTVTTNPNANSYGFYYQLDPWGQQSLTIYRASSARADTDSTLHFQPLVEYVVGDTGPLSTWLTNNPYHHLFDIDYSAANRKAVLKWKQGDDQAKYALPASMNACEVLYRRLGPVDAGTKFFDDPYDGESPFYDPYTSELGYFIKVQFDALVSGLYRVSVRNTRTHQVVAWLTEAGAKADDPEAHWSFLGAGAGKTLFWDGVDQVGQHNNEQSQGYASASYGEFEQDAGPVIGKGFYVWNDEVRDGHPGQLALISGDIQGSGTHPITAQAGAPVFGIGHYATWYVKIEAVNDTLTEVADTTPELTVPRVTSTLNEPFAGVTSLYTGGATQAVIYTHLPRPSALELEVKDWKTLGVDGTPEFDPSDVTNTNNEAYWTTAADADATIHNGKPLRVRFTVQPRPGILWVNKQDDVQVKLSRSVHLRAHINDQFVTWNGANFAGMETADRTVVSRRLVNDSHTIRYDDTGYRKAKDFKTDARDGTEWIFYPDTFRKNFRGVENEPIKFCDYLQLEEVPKWDNNRSIGGTRARYQLGFMNYLFYLSAYTQDRSGRMTWAYNPTFLDKAKIAHNDYSHWWNPATPGTAANSSTFKLPIADDSITQHRRTVVARQWTNEKVDGADWKTAEATRWNLTAGSVGDRLLRHKWVDHEPNGTTLNGTAWNTLGVSEDKYSKWLKSFPGGSGAWLRDRVTDVIGLRYPDNAVNRQLGVHGNITNANTHLGTWSWETDPLWIPCVTRDFHPYFMLPPMADHGFVDPDNNQGYYNFLRRHYSYAHVDGRSYVNGQLENTGDDVAAGDTWSSASCEMTVAYTVGDNGLTFFRAGTKVQKDVFPTKRGPSVEPRYINYVRQDESVHYEDLRGMYSRGPRPGEAPKKVVPVQPYYVNPMQYETLWSEGARNNSSYPLFRTRITKWFDMKFRSEYMWESASWFPVDNFGTEMLTGMNATYTRFSQFGPQLGRVRYDSGAWTGWKDDYSTGTWVHPSDQNLFTTGRMPVGVGPRLPQTKDMIFHMVLVNERRETPATEA